jgi:oligo-1,6-glucosidase/alpha-glucosidase
LTAQRPWWQTTTIYQIYPRSFVDSNDDGIGDLRGIISRLDYIQDLGFETIWASPFFSSPQADWGYDISDYYAIAPEYGDLSDAEALIQAVHDRGMRILFDMVMNHTSDQHAWFQESRSSRDNPRRDWYIWRDGRGKRPPNNWKAITGGSGWHLDETTGQWYYASFLPFQPDLNFRNPAVREAMFDVVRYWLDKGADGFRLDIFHAIFKDERFRDNPFSFRFAPPEDFSAGFFQQWKYNLNQPETFQLAKDLRSAVDQYTPERVLLGELFGGDEALKAYLGPQLDGLHLVFLWDMLRMRTDAQFFGQVIERYESHYPAPYTPVYVFGNHDQKRVMSKIGNDVQKAKLLALFQFTVRGVAVTYYGEEIGMADGGFQVSTAKDPMGRRFAWVPGFLQRALDLYLNRDGCRTPMQWDGGANAGFCGKGVTPWLPVHGNHKEVNVATELADEDSLLNVYRRLLRVRRGSLALQAGTIELVGDADVNENLLAYYREYGDERVLVLINFGSIPVTFQNPSVCRRVLFETGLDRPPVGDKIELAPLSGVILN